MGFFRLKTTNLADQKFAGEAIIAVSETVFSDDPSSEWAQFESDTRQWLYDHHYRYVDASGVEIGDGTVPPEIELVPVYDTPTRMHVRIPWKADLETAAKVQVDDELSYNGSFPALLSRYFMRKCR